MGVFSKCCAKTFLPVMYANGNIRRIVPHLTRVMVLLKHEEPYEAEYDGYGLGLMNTGQWDSAKFVLVSAYAGETYDQLPDSESEPNQGFFFSNEELEALARIPAFSSFEAYEDFMIATNAASEAIYEALLAEIGAPTTLPWYKVVTCFEAVPDCLEMPDNDMVAERYTRRRAEHPELIAFMPEKPADAAAMVEAFDKEYTARARKAYGDIVDAVLASNAKASEDKAP